MILGGKAEGVFEVEVAGGDGRGANGTGDRAEESVIVVCCNAITRFKVDEFRNVLVSVKGIEKLVASGIGKHEERARGHGFSRIPHEEVNLRVVVNKAMVFRHAKPLRLLYLC